MKKTILSTVIALVSLAGFIPGFTPAAAIADDAPAVDVTSGTWHIGLDKLFGERTRRGVTEGKRLDIYPMFVDGKWVNALATARLFNTSIHLVEESDVKVDPDAMTVKGKIKVLMTPDNWIPNDGQAFHIEAEIDGKLKEWTNDKGEKGVGVSGTYKAWRTDGEPIAGDEKIIEANLIGGVGKTETDWGNSVWSAAMNQKRDEDQIQLDLIQIRLGIADGKVNWAKIGPTAHPKYPATRMVAIDVSDFEPVTEVGIAKGSAIITGRHITPGGDPNTKYRIDVTARRVQGLNGIKAVLTRLDADGKPTDDVRLAAGRGGGSRGGGAGDGSTDIIWTSELDTDAWYSPVENFKPVAPGEHPRLLFRKSDLPAIRARAATPEGKQIIARLRQLLGENGEAVTKKFNQTPPHNHNKSPDPTPGTFTTFHAAGFGFLYQLTGEKKYADLAKECVELMLAGKYDIDNRYSWIMPGTDLRCGTVLAAMAYAYDFCYDAWPADFRKKIALEIQNFNKIVASEKDGAAAKGREAKPTDIKKLAGRNGYPPGSNHYGSLIGGTGVAMLAITGDPGVNTEWVEARIAEIESNMPRMLELGFGDAGFYAEGLPPSRLSSNGGFVELTHAMKNVKGRDYIVAPKRNMQWVTLRWIMHLGGSGWASYPNRGTYGGDAMYGKGGVSGTGDFAFGFGTIDPKYKRALLWTYDQFVKSGEKSKHGTHIYNADRYPHRAIFSLIHWPIGEEPQNPAEVLPNVVVDRLHGYVIARNQWQDANDIIVTHHLDYGPRGYYRVKDGKRSTDRPGNIRVWGHGLRTMVPTMTGEQRATYFADAIDGSFSITSAGRGGRTGVACDFSRASGADCVIVAIGEGAQPRSKKKNNKKKAAPKAEGNAKAKIIREMLMLGETKAQVFVMTTGDAPAITTEGNSIKVGGQTFTWDGEKITLSAFVAE